MALAEEVVAVVAEDYIVVAEVEGRPALPFELILSWDGRLRVEVGILSGRTRMYQVPIKRLSFTSIL